MRSVMCGICGQVWSPSGHDEVAAGLGCPSCGGSPLCEHCGHQRGSHAEKRRAGEACCSERVYDFAGLSITRCDCPGYEPRTRDFGAAAASAG